MAEVEISYEFIQQAAQQPGVLAHMQVVADRIKARAAALAGQEGVEMELDTIAEVRPGGRPFVNVVSDNPDQEFGSATSARYRILGRAGEGG
jgi:hypothetical protein